MRSVPGRARPARRLSAALAGTVAILLAACGSAAPPVRGALVPTAAATAPSAEPSPAPAAPSGGAEPDAAPGTVGQPTAAHTKAAPTKSAPAPATAPQTTRFVSASRANLFAGPATTRPFLGALTRGAQVAVLSTSHGWSKIRRGHATAWVWADFLAAHKPAAIRPVAATRVPKKVLTPASEENAPASSGPQAATKRPAVPKKVVRQPAPAAKKVAKKAAPAAKKATKKAAPAPKAPLLVDSIAHRYGVSRVVYATTSVCGALTTSPNQGGILGCFELAHPGQIKVAAWMRQYTTASPSSAGRSRANVTARHETAHALIDRACGTAIPPIAGKRIENIADAYSKLYVGAPTAYYGYTAADAKKAREIHAGHCS